VPKYRTTVHIDAPAEKVWDVIGDFPNIYKFNPAVPASNATSEDTTGLGATRHCDLSVLGASIEERIVDWNDGKSYTVELYETKRVPLLKNNVGHVGVEPNGNGSTGIFEVSYDIKGSVFGRLMHSVAIEKQTVKTAQLFVAGLKHYVETGEEVSKGVRVDTSQVELTRA